MTARPWLIGSEIYRGSTYGAKHPLAIPRVSTTLDLIRALGWVEPSQYIDSPRATPAQLHRFHTPAYVAALRHAEATQSVAPADAEKFHIGANGNPVFREIFSRPATGAGGTLLGAALTRDGGTAHIPGGGTHHGRPDRASGFCYLNDAALGLHAWRDAGLARIVYLDIDAHHGDGVEDAFADDPAVLTISVHEAGRWPHTGTASDRARGILNLAVPEALHDDEFRWLLHEAILPAIRAHAPDAIMLQCGADALLEDPLSRLALSNNAHRAAVHAVRPLAPRLLVLGGGGYNPWSVARCWAGIWAVLNHQDIPDRLPPAAEAVLRALTWSRAAGRAPPEHWFTTLADPPRRGVVRAGVQRLAAAARAAFASPAKRTPLGAAAAPAQPAGTHASPGRPAVAPRVNPAMAAACAEMMASVDLPRATTPHAWLGRPAVAPDANPAPATVRARQSPGRAEATASANPLPAAATGSPTSPERSGTHRPPPLSRRAGRPIVQP